MSHLLIPVTALAWCEWRGRCNAVGVCVRLDFAAISFAWELRFADGLFDGRASNA